MSDEEPLFGGPGGLTTLVNVPGDQLKRGPVPRYVALLEQALDQLTATDEGRKLYGDRTKGASITQAWRVRGALFGLVDTACLFSTRFPMLKSDEIPDQRRLDPAELVEATCRALDAWPSAAIQAFVFDGQSGHSITLFEVAEDGSVVFHDPWPEGNEPWPEGSFLAAGRNEAGVAAERLETGRWRVSRDELGRVLGAAFLSHGSWLLLNGDEYRVSFEELTKGEFWQFFHLREVGREPGPEHTDRVAVAPGAWDDQIGFGFELAGGFVYRARLLMTREWARSGGEGVNPLALDLASSFVSALTPEPERAVGEPIARFLKSLLEPQVAKAMAEEWPELNAFAEAFLALRQNAVRTGSLCSISVANDEADGGAPFIVVEVHMV